MINHNLRSWPSITAPGTNSSPFVPGRTSLSAASVFLLMAAAIATLLSVSTAAWAQTPVIYGLEYHIKNSYGGGSYLDTCGVASCSTTGRYSVVTDSLPDRVGAGTGMWRLESASGKAKGSNVLIGDVVHIRNLYAEGSYLDTCGGASCSTTTQWGVYTDSQPDRAGVGTGKWTVVSAAGKANGSQLLSSDVVHLRNMYSTGSYLDACGGTTCATTTKYGVMTDSQPNRDAGTGLWSFIPFGVAAAPPWNPVGNPAQSSTAAGGIAARALDGNRNGHYPSGSVTHTADGDPYPWWYMDIGLHRNIDMITIFNRTDCCSGRLAGAKIFVSNSPFKYSSPAATEANPEVSTYTFPDSAAGQAQINIPVGRLGRFIRIQHTSPGKILSIAEVAIHYPFAPTGNPDQSSTGYQGYAVRAIEARSDLLNGNFNAGSVTHTAPGDANPWWYWVVKHPQVETIFGITIYNRVDCCKERLSGAKVQMSLYPFTELAPPASYVEWTLGDMSATTCVDITGRMDSPAFSNRAVKSHESRHAPFQGGAIGGPYIRVIQPNGDPLSLTQVTVNRYDVNDLAFVKKVFGDKIVSSNLFYKTMASQYQYINKVPCGATYAQPDNVRGAHFR